MQLGPNVNHGTLIDTYNYAALIYRDAYTNSFHQVVSSRRSKAHKRDKKNENNGRKNVHRRMLKR